MKALLFLKYLLSYHRFFCKIKLCNSMQNFEWANHNPYRNHILRPKSWSRSQTQNSGVASLWHGACSKTGVKKENTDENSGHSVIASSRPPERRSLERRLLVPILNRLWQMNCCWGIWRKILHSFIFLTNFFGLFWVENCLEGGRKWNSCYDSKYLAQYFV